MAPSFEWTNTNAGCGTGQCDVHISNYVTSVEFGLAVVFGPILNFSHSPSTGSANLCKMSWDFVNLHDHSWGMSSKWCTEGWQWFCTLHAHWKGDLTFVCALGVV